MKNSILNTQYAILNTKTLVLILFCLILPQQALAAPPVADSKAILAFTNTPKFITLTGSDSEGRSSMVSSTAPMLTYTVVTPPSHGLLTGTGQNLLYTPESNYKGQDNFYFKVNDGTSDSNTATVSLNIIEWFPPIGIPEPEFGIKETYRMYDDPTKRNPALIYYESPGGGYYTHYVDSTIPGATNASNPYGSPSTPRTTIPANLPEGSVVEIHHASNPSGVGTQNVYGVGTATSPIFVRGVDLPVVGPHINGRDVDIGEAGNAAYIIVEGIDVNRIAIHGKSASASGVDYVNNHLVVRFCDVNGLGHLGTIGMGISASTEARPLTDVVVYDNIMHDHGIWDPLLATEDHDFAGMTVTQRASNVWVVDNEMYHNEGDALQINAGSFPLMSTTHHIYVGRNIGHHNKQSGFWSKAATDIIMSENEVYGIRKCSSSNGSGMGFQMAPQRIWFLYNTIHDCEFGIGVSSNSDGGLGGTESYYVGNLIYDIHYDPAYHDQTAPGGPYLPADSAWSNAGIRCVGGVNRYIISNTLYDCDAGINIEGGGTDYIENNIIDGIGNDVYGYTTENHIWINNTLGTSHWEANNNLFHQTDGAARIKVIGQGVYNLSTLPAGNGGNNIDADSKFVSPESDFHLRSDSPVIDAGTSSGAVQQVFDTFQELYGIDIRKDKDGILRSYGSEWDIGAYEYVAQGVLLYGDVSGDAEISAYDAALTAQAAVGLITLTAEQTQKADVSGDAEVSAYDAALIAQRAVGLIDKFPVEG